jgi:hypothetical protein
MRTFLVYSPELGNEEKTIYANNHGEAVRKWLRNKDAEFLARSIPLQSRTVIVRQVGYDEKVSIPLFSGLSTDENLSRSGSPIRVGNYSLPPIIRIL